MSSSPPPRRSPPPPRPAIQRTPAGRYTIDLPHPYLMGRHLRLSAMVLEELEEKRRLVEGWEREYRYSVITLDALRDRVTRLVNPKALTRMVRGIWGSYVETARPSMLSHLHSVWKHQLSPELGELAVVQLTPRTMTRWDTRQITEGYAPKTTWDAFTLLAAAVRASLLEGEDVPWTLPRGKVWRPSRAPKALKERPACCTADEAEQLIAAALEEDRRLRMGEYGVAMSRRLPDLGHRVTVALLLGLRNGEVSGLGWDDCALDVERPAVIVRHQAVDQWRRLYPEWKRPLSLPKGGKEVQIALHLTSARALLAQRELLRARGWYREDGPVFPGHEGTAFAGEWRNNANGIRPEETRRVAARAGLPFPAEWVTHSLRHSLATVESTSGADLRSIQRRTRHDSLEVLEGYIHARTGRELSTSAIREFDVEFPGESNDTSVVEEPPDTDPCPPPAMEDEDEEPFR